MTMDDLRRIGVPEDIIKYAREESGIADEFFNVQEVSDKMRVIIIDVVVGRIDALQRVLASLAHMGSRG